MGLLRKGQSYKSQQMDLEFHHVLVPSYHCYKSLQTGEGSQNSRNMFSPSSRDQKSKLYMPIELWSLWGLVWLLVFLAIFVLPGLNSYHSNLGLYELTKWLLWLKGISSFFCLLATPDARERRKQHSQGRRLRGGGAGREAGANNSGNRSQPREQALRAISLKTDFTSN